MKSKDEYNAKIDSQLKEMSIKIANLKAKAKLVEADLRAEYFQEVEALRARKEAVQAKLEELKKSGDEAWEALRTGLEQAASELKDAINSAASKFK